MLGLTGLRLYGAIAGAVAVVLLLAWVWRIDSLRARHLKERIACEQNHAQFVADVKARTDEARRLDAAHKATVEGRDKQIQTEQANASNDRIERYRRAATDSVRAGTASTNSGGRTSAPVSSPTSTASGSPEAGGASELSAADRLICATNTGVAEGWQDWWKAIQTVER